jgi:septum formation protein
MKKKDFSLILASSSAPRKELLSRLRIPFQVVIPDADETAYPDEPAIALVRRLSQLKARIIAKQFPSALIIGGDQVGVCEGEILCKPGSHENAIKQLQKLSGNQITFYAGLCLLNAAENRIQIDVVATHIKFRPLTSSMIDYYLFDGKPHHCAGTLMVEQLGIALIEESHSHDPTAIMGLPLISLVSMLMKEGINPLEVA